ncbi:MAG: TetR/AcrR family transcriptional regulator, partial [Balneolaceae bacterium]|nr:TetR/AcrR family transcriptional regulator [Balneolaceae bacterium]
MSNGERTRQEEILQAARQEFINEGFSGARLQGIADNIGVTKAMIHYYFDTKENLFAEVYRDASKKLISGLMDTLEESTPLFQKIDAFIDEAIDRFSEHADVVGFVVNELDRHPEKTTEIF